MGNHQAQKDDKKKSSETNGDKEEGVAGATWGVVNGSPEDQERRKKNVCGDNTLERNLPDLDEFVEFILQNNRKSDNTFFDNWRSEFIKSLSDEGDRTMHALSMTPNLTPKQSTILKKSMDHITIALISTAYYECTILAICKTPAECLDNLLASPLNMLDRIYLVQPPLSSHFPAIALEFFSHLKHLTIFLPDEDTTTDTIETLAPHLQVLEELDITCNHLERIPNLRLFPKLKIVSFAYCDRLTVDDDLCLFEKGVMWFRMTVVSRDTLIELEKKYPTITFKFV